MNSTQVIKKNGGGTGLIATNNQLLAIQHIKGELTIEEVEAKSKAFEQKVKQTIHSLTD